jgi:hypothetical protein
MNSKKTLTHSLVKDAIVKIIQIVNKFNITINFFNLYNFLKEILYLERELVYYICTIEKLYIILRMYYKYVVVSN